MARILLKTIGVLGLVALLVGCTDDQPAQSWDVSKAGDTEADVAVEDDLASDLADDELDTAPREDTIDAQDTGSEDTRVDATDTGDWSSLRICSEPCLVRIEECNGLSCGGTGMTVRRQFDEQCRPERVAVNPLAEGGIDSISTFTYATGSDEWNYKRREPRDARSQSTLIRWKTWPNGAVKLRQRDSGMDGVYEGVERFHAHGGPDELIEWRGSMSLRWLTEWHYDAEDRWVRRVRKDQALSETGDIVSAQVLSVTKREYDQQGRLIRVLNSPGSEDDFELRTTIEYSDTRQVVREYRDGEVQITNTTIFEGPDGRRSRRIEEHANGSLPTERHYAYEFDDVDRLVRMTTRGQRGEESYKRVSYYSCPPEL